MAELKYVGRYPDQDASLVNGGYVEDRRAAMGVNQSQVDAALSNALADRALKSYVDSQDATYPLKTYVDTQDAKYVDLSKLGAANGVASLDASSKLLAAQTPNLRGGATYWRSTGSWSTPGIVSSTTPKVVYSDTISYPGFPWYPLVFAGGWECRAVATDGNDSRVDVTVEMYVNNAWRRIGYGTTSVGDVGDGGWNMPVTVVTDTSSTASAWRFTHTTASNLRVTMFRGAGDVDGVSVYNTAPYLTIIKMPIE